MKSVVIKKESQVSAFNPGPQGYEEAVLTITPSLSFRFRRHSKFSSGLLFFTPFANFMLKALRI
jgi:hypothetical protein